MKDQASRPWPATEIVMTPLADLIPYAGNARTHPAGQVAQIAASIERFGFTIPVLAAEDGTIIAGHGRVLAAASLGLADVPVMTARGWSDEDRRLYTLADNRLAETSEWDAAMLRVEIDELYADGGEDVLAGIGFSANEIGAMIRGWVPPGGGEGDPDEEVGEPPIEPVSRLGDIWFMGDHRLICGDATDAETVAALLGDDRPHLMVTDPPYGVEYDPNWRNEVDRANHKPYGASAVGLVQNDDRADWREAWALFPGEVAYVWHAGAFSPVVADSLTSCGFELRALICWGKDRLIISRGHYHHMHEPCWYAVKKGGSGHWSGDRKQTTLWSISHRKSETGHGTQKPVECMERPIRNNSQVGDLVYEPFNGSGTTIIACQNSGRRARAIELNPAYVDLAVRRWETFTGGTATRQSDGLTFDEVANGEA